MQLDRYVAELRSHLIEAAGAGGEEARAVAERLVGPLESTTRLLLLEALSAAAGEVTAELAPGSVEVRLRGRDPEFVVTPAAEPDSGEPADPGGLAPPPEGDNDARLTLRLPERLKSRLEESAAREGLSTNAWIVRSLNASVDAGSDRRLRRRGPPGAERYTGWVR